MPQATITHSASNENDYKLTRAKILSEQQLGLQLDRTSQEPIETSTQELYEENRPPISTAKQSKSRSTITTATTTTRQYLGDVSNQYHSSGVKPVPQAQLQLQLLKKRKPFARDVQPLQNKANRVIPIVPDGINTTQKPQLANLLVPSRLPQKRQATESSTNLVEKLKIPEPQPHHASASSNTIASTSTYKKSRLIDYEWQDLDEEDYDDPLMASEYVNDIFTYFYELEQRMLPDPQYLYKQKNLKPKMRSILVDWLVEMHLKFKLLPESLFLAINIMDRFMSIEAVEIDKLQLLATGSLFIAAKYEEVFSPLVKNYAFFTDGSYLVEEILQAEKYILTVLNFDLNYPNPMNFLRRISKADDYDVQSRTLGKYLLEITIIDYKFIGMKPSLCCALAMYLSRLILGKIPVWNGNLIHYSGGYRINDMRECVELMFQYIISPIEHDEFFKKYAMRKFMRASTLCRKWAEKFQMEGRDLFDESLSTHRLTIEVDN